jgi:hypothetical protein
MGKLNPGRVERHSARTPGHSVAAMLSLRRGIGISTAIFSIA